MATPCSLRLAHFCLIFLCLVLGLPEITGRRIDSADEAASQEMWETALRNHARETLRDSASEIYRKPSSLSTVRHNAIPSTRNVEKVKGSSSPDAQALLSLKATWNASSTLLQSWNTSSTSSLCSTWIGVSCGSFRLGAGFQGTVYRAELKEGITVAVKRLGGQGRISRSLIAEVKTMAKLQHRHLASIIGCYIGEEILIIYEFVPGGDLHQHLHRKAASSKSSGSSSSSGKKVQDWSTSYDLCLGIARGLKYLHHESVEPIVHRDIKPANVLIGANNVAQITDFGLSRFFDETSTHLSTNMAGSFGYIAPECSEGRTNVKSDVFSFGVVMIEILTGCSPRNDVVDDYDSIAEWARACGLQAAKKFQGIGSNEAEEMEVSLALDVALKCCAAQPNQRPDMISVVKSLEDLRSGANRGLESSAVLGEEEI